MADRFSQPRLTPATIGGVAWKHRFLRPMTSKSGVRWEPTDPKDLDQGPYLAYLEKEEDKVRGMQGATPEFDRPKDQP